LYQELRQALADRKEFVLATVVEAGEELRGWMGQKLFLINDCVHGDLVNSPLGPAVADLARQTLRQQGAQLQEIVTEAGTVGIFAEPFHPAARLLVLGGGHIARPLVAIAALLDYQITVIDDRPEFAGRIRFPQAQTVICDDFVQALQKEQIDTGTSVVIVTRGHRHDLDCLKQVLQRTPGPEYVGMIGSRHRVKMVRDFLIDEGFPANLVDRVHMPIGLTIGAETPEEIAVSIAAQLVEARRGQSAPLVSTSEQWNQLAEILDCIDRGRSLVAATVIRTVGSTPRKAGAKMLVLPDGSLLGTVGGGCFEAAVRSEALMLFDAPHTSGVIMPGGPPERAASASGAPMPNGARHTPSPHPGLRPGLALRIPFGPGVARVLHILSGRALARMRRKNAEYMCTGAVKLHRVSMDAGVADDEGMACGGVMDVFLERLP
jgi:xanthine dehydrogenase accessory factor